MAGMTFDPRDYKSVDEYMLGTKAAREALGMKPIEGTVVERRELALCGLSKNEYIALELTKAWASVQPGTRYEPSSIISYYHTFLDQLNGEVSN